MLIFDEPTQGVDVGTKTEIFSLILELATEGKGIIVICSDFSELETVCTRVVDGPRGTGAEGLSADPTSPRRRCRLAYRSDASPRRRAPRASEMRSRDS